MENKNIDIKSNRYYWVKAYSNDNFEPAKCKYLHGTDLLYFYFTNGSRMEVKRAFEVKNLIDHNDLLEALKSLYNSVDSCIDLTPEVMMKAKEAIEKALK